MHRLPQRPHAAVAVHLLSRCGAEYGRGLGLHANHGERVVHGCRMVQSASDLFLGWTAGDAGREYYVRQLKDMKIKPSQREPMEIGLRIAHCALRGW